MEEYANHWKRFNPEYAMELYDDSRCREFLRREYDALHCDIFDFLQDGPIKADFWRVCILNRFGGVYTDIDNEPLVPIREFIEEDVDLLTCSSYISSNSDWKGGAHTFNPNFIASIPRNPILQRCIQWYVDKYISGTNYWYDGFSVMSAFTDVLKLENYHLEDGIYFSKEGEEGEEDPAKKPLKIQILKEVPGENHYDAHNLYRNRRIFNNRYSTWDHVNHRFFG